MEYYSNSYSDFMVQIKTKENKKREPKYIKAVNIKDADALADSIIGKLVRRGFIKRKDAGNLLLKQIIITHFTDLK